MTLVKFNNPVVNRSLASDAYFSNLVDSFMGGSSDCEISNEPEYKIIDEENKFALDIAIPGFGKSDVKVEVDNGVLIVSSIDNKGDKTRSGLAKSFSKEFKLSKMINQDDIEANVENGILSILLPKKEEVVRKPKREISIL